jgi:hypothetical protein
VREAGGLTEWCRRELGPAGFEGVDALVELRK